MSRYAEKTSVSVENSRGEIERTRQRYGAASFAYGWDQERAVIEFHHQDRKIRFVLPLPDRSAREFTHTPGRANRRSDADAYKAWEHACRQRLRALSLAIKAKLEAVAAGITTFEDEFRAHIVLPDGSTFGLWARPQIAKVYEDNTMPSLLAPRVGGELIVRRSPIQRRTPLRPLWIRKPTRQQKGWARAVAEVPKRSGDRCEIRSPICTYVGTQTHHVLNRSQGGRQTRRYSSEPARPVTPTSATTWPRRRSGAG